MHTSLQAFTVIALLFIALVLIYLCTSLIKVFSSTSYDRYCSTLFDLLSCITAAPDHLESLLRRQGILYSVCLLRLLARAKFPISNSNATCHHLFSPHSWHSSLGGFSHVQTRWFCNSLHLPSKPLT